MGKDYTLFALKDGFVKFDKTDKTYVAIVPSQEG